MYDGFVFAIYFIHSNKRFHLDERDLVWFTLNSVKMIKTQND